GRDRELITEIRIRQSEPAPEPAAGGVPEGRVHAAVRADREQVDLVVPAADAGDGRRRHGAEGVAVEEIDLAGAGRVADDVRVLPAIIHGIEGGEACRERSA